MKKTKEEKAITLIALVITIIVLLILAGVTISTLVGDDGIITKAQEAKVADEISKEKEAIGLAIVSAKVNNDAKIDTAKLKEELEGLIADGTIQAYDDPTVEGIDSITVTGATGTVYTISLTGGTITQTDSDNTKNDSNEIDENGYNVAKGVNAPVLDDDMTLIKYDDTTYTWIEDTNGTSYTYVKGAESGYNNKSQWANAVSTTTNGKNYWVWIPRFGYKDGEVVFLIGSSNSYVGDDGNIYELDDEDVVERFRNSDAKGFWVAKYPTTVDRNK